MARPKNSRRVERAPGATFFTPCGVPLTEAETVTLTVEGLEALRLSDLEGLNASDAAGRCGVSRHAYGRTLAEARRKPSSKGGSSASKAAATSSCTRNAAPV